MIATPNSRMSRLRSLEFWKPALAAPLMVANLPAMAAEKLIDAVSNLRQPPREGNFDSDGAIHRVRRWAQPVAYYDQGHVLYQVDKGLYRGCQPSRDGLADLAEMHVRTVLSLRRHYREAEQVEAMGMNHRRIGVNSLDPRPGQIVEFLRIAVDPACQPVFVHCLHGADRTGMMCAAYRVVVQNWTIDQALDEWRRGPYGFHRAFDHLRAFFRSLDFDAIARRVFESDRYGTTIEPHERHAAGQPDHL